MKLELLREITLTEGTLREFWIWLTSLLFRESSIEPTAERFQIDFGSTSPAFADAMQEMRRTLGAYRGPLRAEAGL